MNTIPYDELFDHIMRHQLSEEETQRVLLEYVENPVGEDSRLPPPRPNALSSTFDYRLLAGCGEDVYISAQAIIKRPHLFKIGSHCAIDAFSVFTTQVEIGDYCHISYGATVIGGEQALLKMGNFSHLAAGARLICATDLHHGDGLVSPVVPEAYRDSVTNQPILIGDFATVGTNAVLMPGVVLARGCVVGANSFVPTGTRLDSWTIYVGSPAKPIKFRAKEKMIQYARELGYPA